jgi:hypothetical protein
MKKKMILIMYMGLLLFTTNTVYGKDSWALEKDPPRDKVLEQLLYIELHNKCMGALTKEYQSNFVFQPESISEIKLSGTNQFTVSGKLTKEGRTSKIKILLVNNDTSGFDVTTITRD